MALKRTLIGLVLGILVAISPAAQFMSPAYGSAASDESAFVARINAIRSARGLQTLQVDWSLTSVARRWAQHQADAGAISHNSALASQVSGDWAKVGENVGVGGSVSALMDAFIASPTHFANIVDPGYNRIGVGVVWKGNSMYTTHDFMQLRSAPAPAAAPAPAPAPTSTPAPQPSSASAPSSAQGESTDQSSQPAAEEPKEELKEEPLKFERTMSSLRGIRNELSSLGS